MKKTTLLICLFLLSAGSLFAQTDYYTVLANNGGTSQNGRSPQGGRPASRSVWLITPTEMANSGLVTGSVINSIGFTLSLAQTTSTTGTLAVYLQNTTDVTNLKSTAWATAITGMTMASNGAFTIPANVLSYDVPFAGGTSFTYNGGGLYVAFDYQNFSNPVSSLNTTLCNTSLTNGLNGALAAAGATTPPATLAASNFRPETRLGRQVSCSRPYNITETVAAKTTNSFTISWTNNTATTIEYGVDGFTPGTGTIVNNVTSPYVVSGLNPSTVYDVYLVNNCGTVPAPVLSAVSDVRTFHTVFLPTSLPYTTGFEQIGMSYLGWADSATTATNAWFVNYGGPGSALVQEGESSAAVITPTAVAANERLYSRGLNLVANSIVTITYYVRNYTATGSTGTASYQLTVGNAQTAAAQTTVLATETGLANTAFELKTYTFTPPADGVYYFGFLHNSPANATGTHALLIDNVNVTQVLGTSEFAENTIAVYPNPVKNVVNISNTGTATIEKVKITDLNGRVVKTSTIGSTAEAQINIADLNTGVYFMEINTDHGSTTKKIIKE